jgi:hypothetical protein
MLGVEDDGGWATGGQSKGRRTSTGQGIGGRSMAARAEAGAQ